MRWGPPTFWQHKLTVWPASQPASRPCPAQPRGTKPKHRPASQPHPAASSRRSASQPPLTGALQAQHDAHADDVAQGAQGKHIDGVEACTASGGGGGEGER
jgi:hypothetical protein